MENVKPNLDINRSNNPVGAADPTAPANAFSWEAPEFEYHEKPKSWVFAIGGAAAVLSVAFLFLKQYLPIAVVILGTIVFYIQAFRKPEKITINIDDSGITIKDRSFTFDDLKSFWTANTPTADILYFERAGRWQPPLSILVIKQNLDSLRGFLEQYLPEQKTRSEELGDRISRFMKF